MVTKITKQINEVIALEKINVVTTQKQLRNACNLHVDVEVQHE
jgi:hypothetical protein